MSIATAFQEVRTKIAACYTAITGKGGTLPATQDLANMPTAINSITGGDGCISRYQVDANGNATTRSGPLNGAFDNIKTIGYEGMKSIFYNCGITGSISFPELTTVDNDGLKLAFTYNPITSISFPKLTNIGGYGLEEAFEYCHSLAGSISFPELTSVGKRGLNWAFDECSDITALHFRADAQAVIEATEGYNSRFGAENATIYFDL